MCGKPAKTAAIGVKVDARGVSRHGFVLNVKPDMGNWDGTIACGLSGPVAAPADLVEPVPEMDDVKQAVITAFGNVFD
jgi:lipoyl(octanoyl) transferase